MFRIKTWIPIEDDSGDQFETREEAYEELEHLEGMQPGNRYEVEEC